MSVATPGALVISIDVELLWGTSDVRSPEEYGGHARRGREAIAEVLRIFERHAIHATWAFVGFLAFDELDDLLENFPAALPRYAVPGTSNYEFALQRARSVAPELLFMPRELERIRDSSGQELGCHSFSHLYLVEAGVTEQDFVIDLEAFAKVARRLRIDPVSYVFPRNQGQARHFRILERHGYVAARGNPPHWAYNSDSTSARAFRLADAALPLGPDGAFDWGGMGAHGGLRDVRASRFLRPLSGRRQWDAMCWSRVARGIVAAAETGRVYHLWWHPENIGADPRGSLAYLERLCELVASLRDRKGFESLTMAEAARRAPGGG